MNGDPIKPKFNLDQDLNSLLDRDFDAQRIIEIMNSAGYDPNEVSGRMNQIYENNRKEQLKQAEEREKILQDQRDMYSGILKKKDTASEPDGEPSRFGLGSIGQETEEGRTPDFMFSESARAERKKLEQPQPTVATADPNVAAVNLIDDQAQEAYFNYNDAISLSKEIQGSDNQDPLAGAVDFGKINKILRNLQSQGMLTQFNVKKEISGKSEAYSPETLAEMSAAARELAKTSTDQYRDVLDRANALNKQNGIDFKYDSNSKADFNLFMAHSIERTIADEKKLQQEVKEEIERIGEDNYYGTVGLGGYTASYFREAWNGTVAGLEMVFHDIGRSLPITDDYNRIQGELYEESAQRKIESDERKAQKLKQLSVATDVPVEVFNMGITERMAGALKGDISYDDFWTASVTNTSVLMLDAFRTAGEFMIGYGIPLATDVFANSYANTRINNPHMGAGEVALHAAPKAATEFIAERYFTKMGLGATGALKDISKNLMGKEALKNSAKNIAKKNKSIVKDYLLPEAFEEGAVELVNQLIDMGGDVAAGRNIRDLNMTQAADAFLGGFAGAVGPSSLASLSSNIGHSRNMQDRQKALEVLSEVKNLHDQEKDPSVKALYREKMVKAMADFDIISKQEQALYSTLNPQEQTKVLGLNQELSRIKEILTQNKYWTGEAVTEEDKATLEKRYEILMNEKSGIEEGALKKAEKASEEPVVIEDASNEEVAAEPQEETLEKANKRKETPVASEPAPKEQIQEEEVVSKFNETKDPEVKETEEAAAAEEATVEETPTEEVSPTFDTEVDGATNFIADTENVGDGKDQMGLRQAQAIDNLTKAFKGRDSVKKVKFYKNYEDMSEYSPEVAEAMKEGKVNAFFDPKTQTVVMHKKSTIKDIREEFGHANLVDVIGKDADSRSKLYNELKSVANKNEAVKKILEDVESNYDGEATIQEESIVKVLREYAGNPKVLEGPLARFVKMINAIYKNIGGKGNIITGSESITKLARKFEMATKGVETEIKAEVKEKGKPDADVSDKPLDFSKKKEFTYLKDTELYYTDVISRTNRSTGASAVKSVKEKSVKVNDYFHYRNLWAKLTGNGQQPSRMGEVFFIKDGKRYNVKPPKPKTDRQGNVLQMPTQMTFVERRLKNHFEQESIMSELNVQRSALLSELGELYMNNDKKVNFYTNMSDFYPEDYDMLPRKESEADVNSEIEDIVIAKKNILALLASDFTAQDLAGLTEGGQIISKERHPEVFNMSGISKFAQSEIDTEVQDPQDTNRDINPDATSSIKFAKSKDSKKYRQNVLDNTDAAINVSSYLGKATDLNKKKFKDIAKDFKDGKVFNVAWDQVAAVNFKFKGNKTPYKTRSGVEEVTTSDFGKSVSFRSKNYRTQFMNKAQDLSGKIHVSISLNDADEMIANPALFEAVVDNVFYQADQGVIDKDVVLKQANLGWNARKLESANSAFEAALKTENSYEFEPLIVKKSDGVYEWKDYDSLKEGQKLFLKADKTTLGHFKRIGQALIRDRFVKEAQIEGDPVLPTISDIREQFILPEYLDEKGNPVESGTIAAVMTIDLDKMRSVSGGFQTRMDKGSSFPYAMNGGLESIVMVEDKPSTQDVYRVRTRKDASMMEELKTTPATAARMALGFKAVTSMSEDLNFSKTRNIDTDGSTKISKTDQGEFELRTMSAFQRGRNRFLQKFANKFQNIYNIQEDVTKSTSKKLAESQDFEMAETLMYGKAANDLEILEKNVESITENLRSNGLKVSDVEQYLYAMHAKERNAVILERSKGENSEGSGISNKRATEILESISDERKVKLDSVVEQIREIQQNTRDTMVKFGLESQETVDVLEGLFKNYVPLGGLATDELDSFSTSYPTGGAGMHVYGSTFKKAEGRKTEAPDILAQIVSQNAAIHIKSRTNEALQSLYELVKNNPNKSVWSIVNKPNDEDPHTVAVRIDGKQTYIRFVDASYAETLRGLNVPASNNFVKLLRAPANWLRASFTTLNPEFMISNFSRDIQSAVFNAAAESEIEGGRLDGAQVVQDMIKTVPSSLKALAGSSVGVKADPLMSRYYEEYKADGGKTGWAYTQKISEIAENLEKQSKDKSKLQRLLGTPKNVADFVEGVNDAFENSIRLSAYISARENGVSRPKAAQFAKNVTVNFNRHGEWGQALNGVYLFFNASVQSSMVIGRALTTLKPATKPDGSQRSGLERVNNAQKLAFGLFLFSGLITMMNRAMSDEDEDGVIFYDKIPDYIKERNIIVMNPRNGRDYYKIPLPYGYSLFSSFGSTVVDVTEGARDWDDALLFLSSSTINAFSPISFGQSKDLFTHLGKSATPTVLKPIVDIMTNETYFGGPVYAEQSPYGVPKPESSMSFRSPKSMQDYFSWLNEATGGSGYVSGKADINPDKLWYILEYAIGGAGKFVNRTGQLVTKLSAKAEDNNFKFDANDLPFARILYGNPSKYYDSEKYSEGREIITQLSKEIKESRRTDDPLRYKGVLALKKRLDTYEKQLKVIRKQERLAREIEDFTKRSIRVQELRDKKNRIFMQFNRAYENFRTNE